MLFNKNKTTLMQAPTEKEGTDTYIVPKTVTEIFQHAFTVNFWLKKLHISASVKSISVFE